jgi:hypothetical protein
MTADALCVQTSRTFAFSFSLADIKKRKNIGKLLTAEYSCVVLGDTKSLAPLLIRNSYD